MSTDLALPTSFNADLAALLGQDIRNGGGGLPLLKINTDHVVEIDGAEFNVPAGSFKLRLENGSTVYGKEATFRPFMQRYYWQRYDAMANDGKGAVTGKTLLVPDFRTDPLDDQGGVACGKLRGKDAKDENNISAEQKLIQKAVQTYRIVYGTVTITDAKTAQGDELEVVNVPVELRLRGANFMGFGEIEDKVTRLKRFLPQISTKLSLKRERKGSTTYYIIGYEYNPLVLLPVTTSDMELITRFNDHVKHHNSTVMEAHKSAMKSRSGNLTPGASADLDGLDADFGDDAGTEV